MKHLLRHAGLWARTLHIYASMAGFLLVLLFAVTGMKYIRNAQIVFGTCCGHELHHLGQM